MTYRAPVRDHTFILRDVLNIDSLFQPAEGFADAAIGYGGTNPRRGVGQVCGRACSPR